VKALPHDTSDKNTAIEGDQVSLAQKAARGDEHSRRIINRMVHPIITYQTNRFCRRFCHGNQFRYVCILRPKAQSRAPVDALLCEFGNASYAWMLEDLTHPKRLLKFEGRNGAGINDYLYYIANSLPFYERWKDWRFGRKIHVPTYIQDLDPLAAQIFLLLCQRRTVADIANEVNHNEADIEELCQRIIAELTRRNRLFLLDPPRTVSLSAMNAQSDETDRREDREAQIPFFDEAPELREDKQLLRKAWGHLSPVEQYVLEAMVIDEQDANDVLKALQKLGVSIKKGVAPADTDRQQLYYFRRKTLSKLAGLLQDSNLT